MAINLYEAEGWINIPSLANIDSNFNIICGPRQVGKTFGTLKYLIEHKKPFIFMRRTPSELDFALNDETSVFKKLGRLFGWSFDISKLNQFIYAVDITYPDGHIMRVLATSLSSLAHIRGFNGDDYEEWVYDEFIPEINVKKMTGEGPAFINGYITINGNRELFGRKAIRVWLLANANNLNSPLLSEMRLTQKVENMSKTGQEYSLLQDRGALIVLPKSEVITEQRAKTALYKLTGTDSDTARMALGNEFAYNDFSDISSRNLTDMVCIIEHSGHYIFRSKTDGRYYCCDKKQGHPKRCRKMSSQGFKKWLIGIGFESFILDYFQHEVIYASYQEKVFWNDVMTASSNI